MRQSESGRPERNREGQRRDELVGLDYLPPTKNKRERKSGRERTERRRRGREK